MSGDKNETVSCHRCKTLSCMENYAQGMPKYCRAGNQYITPDGRPSSAGARFLRGQDAPANVGKFVGIPMDSTAARADGTHRRVHSTEICNPSRNDQCTP